MPRQIDYLVSRHLMLLALLAAQAASSAAQSPGRDETQLFDALPSVFAASRFDQPLSEAPSSVSIVTASDIRRYGYRTLADILGGARGFFTTNDRNYSYAGLRGFARTGDYNSRRLLLIDGQGRVRGHYDSADSSLGKIFDDSVRLAALGR